MRDMVESTAVPAIKCRNVLRESSTDFPHQSLGGGSFRLDGRLADHFAPFLSLVRNELTVVGWRAHSGTPPVAQHRAQRSRARSKEEELMASKIHSDAPSVDVYSALPTTLNALRQTQKDSANH